MRYRIIADNAVDVIFHLRENCVGCDPPSVESAFGDPPAHWIGSNLRDRIYPDDLDDLDQDAASRPEMDPQKSLKARFRVRTAEGGYHWVDGNAKPYLDADGNPDGLIAALRIVDDQVEAQQRLDRLARFDTLTGLPNRAEVIGRTRIRPGEAPIPGLGSGSPVLRRRPLQNHQRHAGPRRRRRGARDPRRARQREHPARRHRRAGWAVTRWVVYCPACTVSTKPPGSPRKSVVAQPNPSTMTGTNNQGDAEHRGHVVGSRRVGHRSDGPRRRGDVSGQAGSPQCRCPDLGSAAT